MESNNAGAQLRHISEGVGLALAAGPVIDRLVGCLGPWPDPPLAVDVVAAVDAAADWQARFLEWRAAVSD